MRIVAITFVSVLVLYGVFITLKMTCCHELLHLPGVVACQRGEAMNVEVRPNRIHGRMETFDLANCTFYWWESNRGGD